MLCVGVTFKGVEDVCMSELDGSEVIKGRVFFELTSSLKKKLEKRVLRSVKVVYSLYDYFRFSDFDDFCCKIKKVKFKVYDSFAVRCDREGEHDFRCGDVEREVGALIRGKVNLEKPNVIVYVDVVDEYCFVGELLGKELWKREYRVRLSSRTINPCIAFAMLNICGFEDGDVLVDPFCDCGIILIEAALFKDARIYGFGNVNDVENTKVNMKVAGVEFNLKMRDVDWLSTEFNEASVDKIVSCLFSLDELRDLFYQSRIVLKKDGKICLFSYFKIKCFYGFRLLEERKVYIGKQVGYILLFGKDGK